MRTVDALIAVRDFFLNNPSRWGKGQLHHEGKFCAIGGISKVTGCLDPRCVRGVGGVGISCIKGPVSANPGGPYDSCVRFVPIGELSEAQLAAFSAVGIELKAARNAIRYTEAACNQLYGTGSIVAVNDGIAGTLGTFGHVIQAFNLAIKNAKRRHINGKRHADKAVAA